MFEEGNKYIVELRSVYRDTQPREDGWRWSKWGTYLGTQERRSEYLYDEPDISCVFTYHIFKINSCLFRIV